MAVASFRFGLAYYVGKRQSIPKETYKECLGCGAVSSCILSFYKHPADCNEKSNASADSDCRSGTKNVDEMAAQEATKEDCKDSQEFALSSGYPACQICTSDACLPFLDVKEIGVNHELNECGGEND